MTRLLERLKTRRLAFTFLILATLSIGILIGSVVSNGVHGQQRTADSSDATPLKVPSPQQMSSTFAQIAKQIEPAVVNINTESLPKQETNQRQRRRGMRPMPPPGGNGDDPFQDFFNRFFGGQGGGDEEGPEGGPGGGPQQALGSGFIVDPKGYILTNNHVVDKADRIRVKLKDDPPGVEHEGKVIGTDRDTDIAVVKIDVNHPLPTVKMGNSDSMQVGDWVLAVGSPFALNETVTAGIISAKNRNIEPTRQFQSFLQTDAAINPGNSGGPLVNMAGEVIGVNTAIYTQSMGYQGIGFAMPSDTVVNVYNQLISPQHRVTRGSIGVGFNGQAPPALARVYGIKNGVVIANVTPGGPADKAGLRQGDAIVSVNGKPIANGDELVNTISALKPGTEAQIGYIRNDQKHEATVAIADRSKIIKDENASNDQGQGNDNGQTAPSKLGIAVSNVTPDMADRLGIQAGHGVVVTDVKPGSFADDIGLGRGDVILEVNKKPVTDRQDFQQLTSGLKSGDDVAFLVQPAGTRQGPVYLAGTLP